MKKLTIKNQEIAHLIAGAPADFPKYTTQLINLANQNAGGTRPKVVGQLSDMIQEFTGKSLGDWRTYYLNQKPDAIDAAAEKIWAMVQNLKAAIDKIDRTMVDDWVHDLVIIKTFTGLRFQEAILARVAADTQATYRLALPEEEAKGIDGFVGETPVSIKPTTYRAKDMLPEAINVQIIFYQKKKDGLRIEWEPW
ncbi:MAG TPA: MjaI family restriction endonuclease [Fimbriimonadaceae bacterium]|nr:MjaI family restriction endonuclease [Fimbriimonadaceae bacterium]